MAADLLAQAEHSADAQAVLVTTSSALAEATRRSSRRRCRRLGRESTLRKSIEHARLFVVDTLETAFELSNAYAPEHLILQVADARDWLPKVRNAGSVFLGAWTPETMGDYCSGTNHVLPTYGFARAYSGLSLHDFMQAHDGPGADAGRSARSRADCDNARRRSKDSMRMRMPCRFASRSLERERA